MGQRFVTRVANPPAQAGVEHGQQESHRRVGVEAPVGTKGSSRGGDGRGHAWTAGLGIGVVTCTGEAVELDVLPFGLGPAYVVTAIERGEGEGGRFALLISEVLAKGEVDGGAEDWEWSLVPLRLHGSFAGCLAVWSSLTGLVLSVGSPQVFGVRIVKRAGRRSTRRIRRSLAAKPVNGLGRRSGLLAPA